MALKVEHADVEVRRLLLVLDRGPGDVPKGGVTPFLQGPPLQQPARTIPVSTVVPPQVLKRGSQAWLTGWKRRPWTYHLAKDSRRDPSRRYCR
ncbi:hypothetical protein ABZV60_32695 [Streptomyces sp. NPDC004787]|uniref:hypothetical protein n=1 Tax=Streptomyces sp. NPDC004787 TaxID=3154291 RepID=UPI0033ADD98C